MNTLEITVTSSNVCPARVRSQLISESHSLGSVLVSGRAISWPLITDLRQCRVSTWVDRDNHHLDNIDMTTSSSVLMLTLIITISSKISSSEASVCSSIHC